MCSLHVPVLPCLRPVRTNTQKVVAHRKRDEQAAGTRRTALLHAAPGHGGHRHDEQRAGPVRIFAIWRPVRGQHIAQPATGQPVSTHTMRFAVLGT